MAYDQDSERFGLEDPAKGYARQQAARELAQREYDKDGGATYRREAKVRQLKERGQYTDGMLQQDLAAQGGFGHNQLGGTDQTWSRVFDDRYKAGQIGQAEDLNQLDKIGTQSRADALSDAARARDAVSRARELAGRQMDTQQAQGQRVGAAVAARNTALGAQSAAALELTARAGQIGIMRDNSVSLARAQSAGDVLQEGGPLGRASLARSARGASQIGSQAASGVLAEQIAKRDMVGQSLDAAIASRAGVAQSYQSAQGQDIGVARSYADAQQQFGDANDMARQAAYRANQDATRSVLGTAGIAADTDVARLTGQLGIDQINQQQTAFGRELSATRAESLDAAYRAALQKEKDKYTITKYTGDIMGLGTIIQGVSDVAGVGAYGTKRIEEMDPELREKYQRDGTIPYNDWGNPTVTGNVKGTYQTDESTGKVYY